MMTLIVYLITLLGYGTPQDYVQHTEQELVYEIQVTEQAQAEGGLGLDLDDPS